MKRNINNELSTFGKDIVQEAEDISFRARKGDQNAMAQIEQVGKNARAGQDRAKKVYALISQYIHEHPLEGSLSPETQNVLASLSHPDVDPTGILHCLCFLPQSGDPGAIEAACVLLANGPNVNAARLAEIRACVEPALLQAFDHGLANAGDAEKVQGAKASMNGEPNQTGALCAGNCLGIARKIQLFRSGKSATVMGADIGLELCPECPQ